MVVRTEARSCEPLRWRNIHATPHRVACITVAATLALSKDSLPRSYEYTPDEIRNFTLASPPSTGSCVASQGAAILDRYAQRSAPWCRVRQQIRFGPRSLLAFWGNLPLFGPFGFSRRRPDPIDRKPAAHLDEARRQRRLLLTPFTSAAASRRDNEDPRGRRGMGLVSSYLDERARWADRKRPLAVSLS